MDVLGVDPSLSGTGLARVFGSSIETALIVTEPAPTLKGTRDRIRYIVGRTLRFAPRDCLTVIEAPIIPQHGGGAVLERAWLFGLLVDQLMLRGPVVQVRPPTRAMYATGNGRASKPEVLAVMRTRFPGLLIPDDNVADALAMCAMGARWGGSPIDGEASSKQVQAMVAVHWPMEGKQ